jgi:hypothetical protein
MAEMAWRRRQREIARQWGGTGTWRGQPGSDGGDGCPVSLEVKRSKRTGILATWITQARTQGKTDRQPWVLVVAGHNDRQPIAVVDHGWLLNLARQAGLLQPELPYDDFPEGF